MSKIAGTMQFEGRRFPVGRIECPPLLLLSNFGGFGVAFRKPVGAVAAAGLAAKASFSVIRFCENQIRTIEIRIFILIFKRLGWFRRGWMVERHDSCFQTLETSNSLILETFQARRE